MGFDYVIAYRQGAENTAADALSQKPVIHLNQIQATPLLSELIQAIQLSYQLDFNIQTLILA